MATLDTADVAPAVVTPVVDADLCVHGLSPVASCKACVTACPSAAFALDDDGLDFDAGRCDGCALCVPACPQGAIDVEGAIAPSLAPPVAPDRAYAACERAVPVGEAGRVTCLHALSERTLSALYAKGIRGLFVASADCATCTRNIAPPLSAHVDGIARLLADRELPALTCTTLSLDEWRQARDEAGRMSRRSLFRFAVRPKSPASAMDAPDPATQPAPGATLPARDRAHLSAIALLIDQQTCTACGACVEVCPHGVLRLEAGSAPHYAIDATLCTGCGLCSDTCDVSAISLKKWQKAHIDPIPLVQDQCKVCGSPFYEVAGRKAGAGKCRICAAKTHRQKLFQVLP